MDYGQAPPPAQPQVGYQQPLATAPPMEPPPAYAEFPPSMDPKMVQPGTGAYPHLPNEVPLQPPPHQQQPMPQPGVRPHTVYVGSVAFASRPQRMHCTTCQQEIVTRISTKPGLLTYLLCGGLAFFGCWICCCIPFCVEGAQDIEHFCPKCNRFLGTYKRI
ncbi:hypothetical protein PRIPAC_95979 [Pristionchus pacificus]|uniref:LITAF domain-containing protein n=1 Tax=Pristionchus pacificus TaxID=54126 RepID=A0A2A6CUU1_PRIPA|nr:hypothetical protein PRIPAC_95979 [Pristionchus pacificus]|eukprot:PDM81813.1 hypothetical protein PRIPAC_33967 [Pristionchus pacificus]